jgi:hypothetical protein
MAAPIIAGNRKHGPSQEGQYFSRPIDVYHPDYSQHPYQPVWPLLVGTKSDLVTISKFFRSSHIVVVQKGESIRF